jgi:hypothetical protein
MRKGVSEVVSFVLIVAIMITATMGAYLWASSSISNLNEPGRIKNLVNQMLALDGTIKSVAHGDINFTSSFDLYYPDSYLEIRNATSELNSDLMIVLVIRQKAMILGYANMTSTVPCNSNYSYDAATHTTMYRYTTGDSVYVGAQGDGPGQAEISICYTNINLTYAGNCVRGKTGPFANLRIKKDGLSGSMPQVSIDVC